MFTNITWIILFAAVVNTIVTSIVLHRGLVVFHKDFYYLGLKLLFFALIAGLQALRPMAIQRGFFDNPYFYYSSKLVELILTSFAIIVIDIGRWAYILFILTIFLVSITKGKKPGIAMTIAAMGIQAFILLLKNLNDLGHMDFFSQRFIYEFLAVFFVFVMIGMFALLCGQIHKENLERDRENQQLMSQLEEKYFQLEIAQDEIKLQYEKLKGSNNMLEETNRKLTDSIAEFYTLQQISQAISSILDIRELLKYLNDIIIGVMGVSNSTILLFDEKTRRFKVQVTNIINSGELAILTDNINCRALQDALEYGNPILENYIAPQRYAFTAGRDINSLICIPLNTKSKKYGLVLVEHKYTNAFDEDNVRLLGIIAQQVGIAMENAELYQKMQELASRDGLTEVYNRQYFKERLETEFNAAFKENYPLSLAIYDIDHFKKFNDTFGHLFGDKVLKSIAEAISGSLRKTDVIARFGGEEFVILFPRTNLEEAREKAEALRKMIAQLPIKDDLVTATVTVSFGVSSYNECALSQKDLLRTADDALYEAKAAGRNCVRTASRLFD